MYYSFINYYGLHPNCYGLSSLHIMLFPNYHYLHYQHPYFTTYFDDLLSFTSVASTTQPPTNMFQPTCDMTAVVTNHGHGSLSVTVL